MELLVTKLFGVYNEQYEYNIYNSATFNPNLDRCLDRCFLAAGKLI
jgi:hypothetical protein